jgi:hypothetical protein
MEAITNVAQLYHVSRGMLDGLGIQRSRVHDKASRR